LAAPVPVTEEPALREMLRVEFDARRPWPLGLPSKTHALGAIISHCHLAPELEGSHLHALTSFPEWVFDEARTGLVNSGTELAWASASAWRAVVALDTIDAAISVDLPALLALIDEVVAARERLVGYSTFALDGGIGSADLLSTLDECIGRFVVLARFQERQRPPPPPPTIEETTRILSVVTVLPEDPKAKVKRRLLPVLSAAVVLLTLGFHVSQFVSEPDHDGWVVNGSLDSGHATLVPEGPRSSEAALQVKIAELRKKGISVQWSTNGEWTLSKGTTP
jgi:hypothetical protein